MIGKLLAWYRAGQARRLAIADFQWQMAEAGLPFLDYLSPEARQRLRDLARQFIIEKQWHGARGLAITAEMQLAIALQACLPVLELGLGWYAGWIGIVIYPGDFVIPRQWTDEDGIVHEFDDEVLGEAWDDGPVLLSWFEPGEAPLIVTGDDQQPINIVIHEFAHKLDMSNGLANGMPLLHHGMSRQHWMDALGHAFEDLNQRLDRGETDTMDPYGADDIAEFFAVASESFFTRPQRLIADYPAVYAQLALFYRQDPASGRPTHA